MTSAVIPIAGAALPLRPLRGKEAQNHSAESACKTAQSHSKQEERRFNPENVQAVKPMPRVLFNPQIDAEKCKAEKNRKENPRRRIPPPIELPSIFVLLLR